MAMKTEHLPETDAIWTENVDLLPAGGCLPVIGSCQVSSILSNLDAASAKSDSNGEVPQSVDLISLQNSELKLPPFEATVQNNYVVLKEDGASTAPVVNTTNNSKANNNDKVLQKNGNGGGKKNVDNFEDLLYFACDLCPFLCTKNEKITEHLENAHKNKTVRKLPHLKCPACANVFFHKMSFRSHLIHDHGVGNSDLSKIVQAVGYYANKAKNNEAKNKNKGAKVTGANPPLGNSIKNASFNSIVDEAKPVFLPKVEISQDNAEKAFNQILSQQNGDVKSLKKIHRCTVASCKTQMNILENINYHMSCHKDSSFICRVCNETFSFWKPLSSHLWRVHKIDMELYSCDKCSYKSISLAKLNNVHKLIHSDVKAFVCNICKKGFKNSKQLGNHKATHKNPFEKHKSECEICSKNFSDKRQLKIHMDVVHEKIKRYLCNYCPYKGSSRSSLKMHIRQHTGEKPFACDSCSYITSDHNSLRRHKLRHTGQKPYKCSYCSYACIQSSTYKVHLKTKHPGQEKDLMFTCQECQFRSVNKDIYIAHMITVHEQKPTNLN